MLPSSASTASDPTFRLPPAIGRMVDDRDSLPPPDEIAGEIAESLEAALQRFRSVVARLS